MFRIRALLSIAVGVAFGIWAIEPAPAQVYPTRPIKIIVPFPPGNNADLVSHFIGDRLSSSLGQPVVIDYRPGGAGGTVGAKLVASADPDGYTLLLSPPGPLVVAPAIYKNVGYDPAKNLAPIATLFSPKFSLEK